MQIIEYNDKYLEDVKDLLVELEEYIISIDKDNLDRLHSDYRDIEDDKAIGLIMGCIFPYSEFDYLDYKCPNRGEIIELIVTKKVRSKGIGNSLITKMEEYFKSVGCDYVLVDVFAYNDNAINFYNKKGYHPRMYRDIKKLN